MPTPWTWLPRIDGILSIIRAAEAETFDRTAIEKLFEIQRRTALLLMNAAGAEKSGSRYVVKKVNLLLFVEAI